ncbi:MAG: protein arginine kinase [Candidatus Omnitrophica bacterium]|nr:protein arginine kinase [Candidatus Omnitrophota bacterium]
MKTDDFLKSSCGWLKGTGQYGDIVISSRIRLARNLKDFHFEARLNQAKAKELIKRLEEAVHSCNYLKKALFVRFSELSELDKQLLLERHLISREHSLGKGERAVCISENEIVSIMVVEEDHLRMQVLQSGFSLSEAWRILSQIDSELERFLEYAFDSQLGYLTACPTNVGTGLRASTMLHLPALIMTKEINKILQALAKLNLASRGFYGEGTQASGNFFQFSNQITLGHSEEDIIDNLERVLRQVIEHEKEARLMLFKKRRGMLEDQIWRALGTLKSARIISSQETISLLSLVRLGLDLGLVAGLDVQKLNDLFLLIQPAHLQKLFGKELSAAERDSKRAELIRSHLKSIVLV